MGVVPLGQGTGGVRPTQAPRATAARQRSHTRRQRDLTSVGWTGDDVWHAHCVQLNSEEINLFAKTGTGIAHCPCSNMRLASGIAPVRQMLDSGVKVGLGVDGSASNDSGNMLNEARQTMLLQRVNSKASSMTAREALKVATRGGASVLNRDDIGVLAPGYAADITAFKRNNVDFSGSDWDPVASLVFCGPVKANYTIINGKVVVTANDYFFPN